MLIALALAASVLSPQTVSSRQIEEAVGQRVQSRLGSLGSHAQWRVAPGIRDQQVPAGRIVIDVGEPAGRFPRGRVGLPVRLQVDGKPVRTVTAWIEMQDPQEVPVYAADYPRGHSSEAIQYTHARVDMVCCAGAQIATPDQLAHMQLARATRAGQPVLASDYMAIPQVRSRQPVEIIAGNEQIRIALQGISMADGYLGDRVSVRPATGSSPIRSVVIGEGKVRADE